MRIPPRLPGVLLLVGILAFAVTSTSAVTLYGKVTAINEGDLFTIVNLNRPVLIRMSGIDAPEKGQPYADTAIQHLSELILGKLVTVEYSGLAQHNQIVGRVYVNNLDVGAQMVRDGVAWFDAAGEIGFSQVEKDTYFAIEQAARDEHRGIWEDKTPVSPWDYRRSLAMTPIASGSGLKNQRRRPAAGLSSDDLMSVIGGSGGGSLFGKPGTETYPSWRALAPKGYNFSVLVPGTAVEEGVIIPTSSGDPVDANVCFGANGSAYFVVMWAKGPNDGLSDADVMDPSRGGFASHVIKSLTRERQGSLPFSVEGPRSLRSGAFTGREYKLSGPITTGTMRLFTRQTAGERHIYMLLVGSRNANDPLVAEFLNSLNLGKK